MPYSAYLHHIQGLNYGSQDFFRGALLGVVVAALVSLAYCWWSKPKLPGSDTPEGWKLMLVPALPTLAICVYIISTKAELTWAFLAPIVLAVAVGVGEELIFRKVVLSSLLQGRRPAHAIIISGLIFSALHAVNVLGGQSVGATFGQLVSTFVAGVVYGVMYLYTKRIGWLIAVHAMWDYIGFSGAITPGSPLAGVLVIVPLLEVITMVIIIVRHKSIISAH